MKIPTATYRVQLSPEFTFEDLRKIIPYLKNLGISTIYAAPILQSRNGSTHGYDGIDPNSINKDIGSLKELRNLKKELENHNIGWLQDIVPNHMAFDPGNVWLKDIFELGPDSKYYNYFDIDWHYKNLEKIITPFFGKGLDKVLNSHELILERTNKGFFLTYFDQKYPVSARSYPEIITTAVDSDWSGKFQDFQGNQMEWDSLKTAFLTELQENQDLRSKVESQIKSVNQSEKQLRSILEKQFILPSFWKKTTEEINYRRFFTINDLICLRMEDPAVFNDYHYFIKELLENNLIDGLRIDHVDGLFNPAAYLKDLRELVGKDAYIVVEKILEKDENIPQDWPIQGSSGYDFLGLVNQLFTQRNNKDKFTEAYKKMAPGLPDFQKLVFEKKLFILKERMGGELRNLWRLFLNTDLFPKGFERTELKEAFCAFLASFPIYRLYVETYPFSERDRGVIQETFETAQKFSSKLDTELKFWKSFFTGEIKNEKSLYFIRRCQQFTGPLAAKGAEDTAFYIYNRLISHNEVGDSPEEFGISSGDFHQKMLERQKHFPHSLNASATHDTKRGEDARMRLNVLSEIPEEWFSKVEEWQENNKNFRKENGEIPDSNYEYLIYQALLAAMPLEDFPEEDFLQRTFGFIRKAVREAKINSSWAAPDENYEAAVFNFIRGIFNNSEFRNSFDKFHKKIAYFGAVKSLGQILLKITAPGIPDIYQGSELWDLSYVDPDNRRPVNFGQRENFLDEFKDISSSSGLADLKRSYSSGKIKLFCLNAALQFRRKYPEIFEKGEYIPVPVSGKNSHNFICYLRQNAGNWILILIPIGVTQIFEQEDFNIKSAVFDDVFLELPKNAPESWKNVFSGEEISVEKPGDIERLLDHFSVIFLKHLK